MNKKILRICALIWGISGVVILLSAIYPIVSYESKANEYYELINPLINNDSSEDVENYDYTRASNWFAGGASKDDFISSKITHYSIDIPALGIKDATVSMGGEDLSESLIQYPGTAIPGRQGNTVVFGHSILPQFFNPEDYLAIFSTLPHLDIGNRIYINYDGIKYKYVVENMFEVNPMDIKILEQKTNDVYLSLVTCIPPGHPLKPKRLIVRAKLEPVKHANENPRN